MLKDFPAVGTWYQDAQQGICFEVVAVDTETQTIEVQLLEGEVTEFEFESWNLMQLEPIEEPEDWRNGFELASEDSLDPDLPYQPESWVNPLEEIEPQFIHGLDDY